jgi:hypothetical protein
LREYFKLVVVVVDESCKLDAFSFCEKRALSKSLAFDFVVVLAEVMVLGEDGMVDQCSLDFTGFQPFRAPTCSPLI